MPTFRRLHLGLAFVAAALPLSCGGCERRVEEPLPEVHPLTRVAEPLASAKPWGKRCVQRVAQGGPAQGAAQPRARLPQGPGEGRAPADGQGDVRGYRPSGGATVLNVEIAEKDHDRQRGLMYRTSMADDHGMIFGFEQKDDHTFWMHNTCIPLDMLFIDDDGLIVGIEENTPTLSDDTFSVGCESKYVLEVNAGWTRAHGVFAGQKVKIDGI